MCNLGAGMLGVDAECLHQHLGAVVLHRQLAVLGIAQCQRGDTRTADLTDDRLFLVLRDGSQYPRDAARSHDLDLDLVVASKCLEHLKSVDHNRLPKYITSNTVKFT